MTREELTAELSHLAACAPAIAAAPEAFDLEELVPRYARLVAAIEAVLTYHRKMTVCEISIHAHDNSEPPRVYCGHSYAETENSRHVMDDDDNIICLDKPVADVCESCRDESGEAEDWPCSEYRAITQALSGNPGAQEAQRGEGAEDG